jgi:hypothetical protein
MAKDTIMSVTPETMGEILQSAGCRVEHAKDPEGIPVIGSATNGMTFNIRFVNKAPAPLEGYIDLTYITILKFDQPLPLETINEWNRSRRFARLNISEDLLIMDMDVILSGGVSETHLRTSLEIWDRMMQELIAFIRNKSPAPAAANAS